jgi:hypothetical protein
MRALKANAEDSTALLILCLVGSLTVGCSASWAIIFSFEEMTQRADVILAGRVESIWRGAV